ncbi:MAG: hypothetical protein ACK5LN_14300 [Propioniciclava sp.]
MNKFVRHLAVGGALAALVLTGCSQPPTAAAVVEGTPISDRSVRETIGALAVGSGVDPAQIPPGDVARSLIVGAASEVIAAEQGVSVEDGAIDAAIAADPQLARVAVVPGTDQYVRGAATFRIVLDKIGEAAYRSALAELDVEMNPRYGSWIAGESGIRIDSSGLAVDPKA